MAKTFEGKYLGGHPALGKEKKVKVRALPGGLRIAYWNSLLTYGSKLSEKSFVIPWSEIKGIEVQTEKTLKNRPGLFAAGALAGNTMAMLAGAMQQEHIKQFLAIDIEDGTGFKSVVLFAIDRPDKVRAFLVHERGRFLNGPSGAGKKSGCMGCGCMMLVFVAGGLFSGSVALASSGLF